MKLILTMKLADHMVINMIYPLTKIRVIEKVILVRDTPSYDIDKVQYITPSKYGNLPSILTIPIKFIQLAYHSIAEKPSLIHSYLLFPHGYLALFAGKLTRRKVGVSLIAGPVETYTLGKIPIQLYPYCYPLPQSTFKKKMIISILSKFDIITVTGSYTKDYLINSGIEENKIFILPHAVDHRFKQYPIKKEYDLIYLGRLAPVKHVETILRLTAEIKTVIPSIRVAIVGSGNEREDLETLSRSLDLTDQIHFAGYQSDIWEWYNRSKISVIASEREGFPYTAIESLKCGLPVVTSDCGDICDIVKDSYNGFIISDYQDYNAYAEVIIKLLTNPDMLEVYSNNALKSVENVSSDSVEKVWENIIKTISTSEDDIIKEKIRVKGVS